MISWRNLHMPPCDKAPREDSRRCPNLIWELNRARRAQLSAQQLLTRNVSERVVDKDNHNHLRDCLKYLVLSLPAPAQDAARSASGSHGQMAP
jgi:hypothetical protein